MVSCDAFNSTYFMAAKPAIISQMNSWIQPYFQHKGIPIHMHMTWFTTIIGVEIKAIFQDMSIAVGQAMKSCRTTYSDSFL